MKSRKFMALLKMLKNEKALKSHFHGFAKEAPI